MMESLVLNPLSIKVLDNPEMIWDSLTNEKEIQYFWLGKQPYTPIWELQKQLHAQRVAGEIPDVVLLLEHDHVYTFGKNAETNHLLDSYPTDAEVVQIDRGGDITYHGPGQLVGYPIVDLHHYKMSVSWYMRTLEKTIINTLAELSIKSKRRESLTGVWVEDEKICAMGVRLAKWVTMHGFALNLNPDMKYFDGMIPCGIFEYGVTSIQDFNINLDMIDLAQLITENFSRLFLEERI